LDPTIVSSWSYVIQGLILPFGPKKIATGHGIVYIREKSGVHLVFVWGVEKCFETNLLHPKNLHRKLVLKNMSRVWEEINLTFRQLDQFYTLLIDDCPYK
jgi:hypothetical protein